MKKLTDQELFELWKTEQVNGWENICGNCFFAFTAGRNSTQTNYDINSAPKDGTRILLYGCEGWQAASWNGELWLVATTDCSGYNVEIEVFNPTHWRPLPDEI